MPPRPFPALALLGVGAASAAGFAALARRVAHDDTRDVDASVRKKVRRRRGPRIKKIARALGPLGKASVHGPAAALLAAYTRPRSRAGALAIGLSSAASAGLSNLLERTLDPRTPPPGKDDKSDPSFPSGHALETTAVALTTAYVLAREKRGGAWAAGRMYLDRHWASDVVGGWLAGISVAACCAAAYELLPD